MKTIFSIILIIGAMSFTMASEEKSAEVPVSLKMVDQEKFLFRFKANPEGPVRVKIFDENRTLIKSQRINSQMAFAKYYDFSQMLPGKYTLEVIDGQRQIDRFSVNFTAPKTEKPVVFSKLEELGGNSYKLSVNSLLPADLSILVFENDILVHEEKLHDVNGFQKLYKLQGISPTSKVEFFVKTNEGYAKTLAIR